MNLFLSPKTPWAWTELAETKRPVPREGHSSSTGYSAPAVYCRFAWLQNALPMRTLRLATARTPQRRRSAAAKTLHTSAAVPHGPTLRLRGGTPPLCWAPVPKARGRKVRSHRDCSPALAHVYGPWPDTQT